MHKDTNIKSELFLYYKINSYFCIKIGVLYVVRSILLNRVRFMSQVKSISFKNYKAFGNEQVQIVLKPITLFIGKNSSGKSSLLKLISILSSLTAGKINIPMVLKNENVSLGGRYEDIFHNNQTTGLSLGIEFDNGVKINISYYIDKGELYVYEYDVEDNERKNIKERSPFNTPIDGFLNKEALDKLNISTSDLSFRTVYIGPVREQPNRNIEITSNLSKTNVGANGSNTYSLLLKSYLSEEKVLFHNVSSWLEKNLEHQAINFERNSPSSGSYSLYIQRGDAKVNISDVGQGLAQVLPIITQSYITDDIDIMLVEQPALHLHPAAHASVAYQLADMAKSMNRKCIIETHSENILLAIRNLVADKSSNLSPDDVIIYFIDSDEEQEAFVQEITIDEMGQLSTWPEGVFSEGFDLLAQIMQHRKK